MPHEDLRPRENVADESIIGRYARVVVDRGTDPLREGLRLACRITGLAPTERSQTKSSLRGEVVSNDVDGPLAPSLLEGALIITPVDPDASEAKILERGSFPAEISLWNVDGVLVARGEGVLLRISDEIPYERTCPDCQGWKICEDCGGTGSGPDAVCVYCNGTGRCTRCEGTGSVTESG